MLFIALKPNTDNYCLDNNNLPWVTLRYIIYEFPLPVRARQRWAGALYSSAAVFV